MGHIKPSSMVVSLVVILPLLWKGITSQDIHTPGFSIQVSSSVSVQEGLCVTVPCTFTADDRNTFRNSTGYWVYMLPNSGLIVATNNKSSVVHKQNFNQTGNPDTGDCTLTITDARKEDEGTYIYRFDENKDNKVKYTYNREMTTTITVTDLSEEPVISGLGTLTAGIEKTVTCAAPGNCSTTSLVFQWKKSDVPGIWKNSPSITFIPSPDDHQKNITCEMTNSKGNTTHKTILLDVVYLPRNMEINIHSSKGPASQQVDIDQTETLTLVCRADGNPPVTVVWMRGEDDTNASIMSNSGLSTVINETSSVADVYRCSARNVLGLRELTVQVGRKHDGCMDSTTIIGMVIGNIVLLILIIVGSYFLLKRRMEKRLLEKRSPDPVAQETESTYQELQGRKDDVYHDLKVK